MKTLSEVFTYIGVLLLFINACLYTKSYLFTKRCKLLKYYVIYLILMFCILTSSLLIVLLVKDKPNNLFLSHFYFIFQFVFLSLFYFEQFGKKQRLFVRIISGLVFAVLGLQYGTTPSLFYKFNLLEILLTSFPLVIYSLIHLFNALGKPGKYMYVNASVLIYLSVSTLIFILGTSINNIGNSISINIWFLNKVFYVVYLVLILIEWKVSLWKTTKS